MLRCKVGCLDIRSRKRWRLPRMRCKRGRRRQNTYSSLRRSINSGPKRSPVRYSMHCQTIMRVQEQNTPNRCLSGRAGTTHAGKSFTRWSRRNTKSWNRRREEGLGVEKIGRFVCKCFRICTRAELHVDTPLPRQGRRRMRPSFQRALLQDP